MYELLCCSMAPSLANPTVIYVILYSPQYELVTVGQDGNLINILGIEFGHSTFEIVILEV